MIVIPCISSVGLFTFLFQILNIINLLKPELVPLCDKFWWQKFKCSSVMFWGILSCLINLFWLFAETTFTLAHTANEFHCCSCDQWEITARKDCMFLPTSTECPLMNRYTIIKTMSTFSFFPAIRALIAGQWMCLIET